MYNEPENTSHVKFLGLVIQRTTCKRHGANTMDPCWWIYPASGRGVRGAICNHRARNAGFVGRISVDPKYPKKSA